MARSDWCNLGREHRDRRIQWHTLRQQSEAPMGRPNIERIRNARYGHHFYAISMGIPECLWGEWDGIYEPRSQEDDLY